MEKRFPCIQDPFGNGTNPHWFCLSLLGPIRFRLPENDWICESCNTGNINTSNFCIQCDSPFNCEKISHSVFRTFAVPCPEVHKIGNQFKDLIIRRDNDYNFTYNWTERIVGDEISFSDATFLLKPTYSDQLYFENDSKISIKQNLDQLTVAFYNNTDDDILFEIYCKLKPLPKTFTKKPAWSETKNLFDFETHRGFYYKENVLMFAKFNLIVNPISRNAINLKRRQDNEEEIQAKKKKTIIDNIKTEQDLIEWDKVPLICYDIETCLVEGQQDEFLADGITDFMFNPYMVSFYMEYKAGVDLRVEENCFYNTKPYGCNGVSHLSFKAYENNDDPNKDNRYTPFHYLQDKHCFTNDQRYFAPADENGNLSLDQNSCCTDESRQIEKGFIWIIKEIISCAIAYDYEHFVVIGFNNYRFDDILTGAYWRNCFDIVLNELNGMPLDKNLRQRCYNMKIKTSERNNKVTASSITVKVRADIDNQELKEYIEEHFFKQINIYFKDLVQYCPNETLQSSCENYGVPGKTNLDVVKINAIIEKEKIMPELIPYDVSYFKTSMPEDIDELEILEEDFFNNYIEDGQLKLRKILSDYCKQDVKSTLALYKIVVANMKEILTEFFGENHDKKHPMAFISLAQFSKYILDETNIVTYEDNWAMEDVKLISDTMFAGRTDFGILGNLKSDEDDILDVDVKAMYPTAMTAWYPNSARVNLTTENIKKFNEQIQQIYELRQQQFTNTLKLDDDISYFQLLESTFFCYGDIEPPGDERLINWGPLACRLHATKPILAQKYEKVTRLQFCNFAQKRRALNSVQIKTLLFGGWKVNIDIEDNYGFYWPEHEVPLFSDFMSKFAKIKSTASAAKTVKLLMNSITGKFGQRSKDVIDTTCREYVLIPEKTDGSFSCARQPNARKPYDRQLNFYDDHRVVNFNSINTHYLASLIWSWSHFLFWTTCYKTNIWWINAGIPVYDRPPILLYCDTDSIFLSRKNSNIFETKQDVVSFFKSGDEMGSWVMDKHEFDVRWSCKFYDRILVMAKKSYWVGTERSSCHFKGVMKDAELQFIENGGYEKIVEVCRNHIENLTEKDGITDRNTSICFSSEGIERNRIDNNKWLCTRWLNWRNTLLTFNQKIEKQINFTNMYDTSTCKFFDEYLQVFSPNSLNF